ncbi:polycomb group protein Psc isoform X2 [Drosophila hydei]|nr:polycomb group protein Psc isoform X2 [Drosophila hydei]
MVINNAKPNIKSDTTLQAIVYKLVPGLYERELMRKRAFYKDRPQEAALATPEQRGDDTEHLIFSPSDDMSLSLEYAELGELNIDSELEFGDTLRPRYLQCPAMCRVSHLKKFVYDKYEIDAHNFSIDIMYKVKTIALQDYYTLMDIAYIYTWKRDAPMRFYFRVYESPKKPLIKPAPIVVKPQILPLKQELVSPGTTPPTPPLVVKVPTLSPPAIVAAAPPTPSPAQSPRIKVEQPQEEFRIAPKLASPTEQSLKLVINRNVLEKHEKHQHPHQHQHHHSPKSNSKSPTTKCPPPQSPGSYNKEEPNIKLKIDLSKQNSVTIINMSDPDRKEIVKPLKPEKESRSKSKKDKDGSPKSSSNGSSPSSSSSERKRKSPSPLTVPPLTIRTERILSPNGVSTVLSPRVTSGACLEDPKSEFLKSFALTPIKVKLESPEKQAQPKHNGVAAAAAAPANKSKAHLDDSLLMKPPSAMPPKSIASSKRKSKEPVKALSKKPKLSPPLPREDFKIRLTAPTVSSSNCPSPPAATDKPLMPPPPAKPPLARHNSSSNKVGNVPQTPQLPLYAPQHHAHPLQQQQQQQQPHYQQQPHHAGLQMSAPGNRTPIAKRYQPILPKAARPNPFANIPSDVNRLLKDAGTEIKTIGGQSKSHVYGPKQGQAEHKMGPPPVPKTNNNNNNSNNSSNNNNSNSSNKSNNYLNLALFNASKSKGKEAPPGCRTPMYTPNSPIYSPSSPQYVPNYNIPTMPTYKYTPKPTNTAATTTTTAATTAATTTATTNASNYLQSMLNGAAGGGLGGGLFPSPPTKADQNTNPVAEDAPEKQQVKVKSLLNSCNINIPSSLSITISRDNGDASSPSSGAHAKHKSPVNNYIEIVKLPDQPAVTVEKEKEREKVTPMPPVKLPAPPSKTIPSPQHLLARLTPPSAVTTAVPPKTSPKATPTHKPVLQPQQMDSKKTPSPEKRSSQHSPNASENKSPKAGQAGGNAAGAAAASSSSPSTACGETAAKKFRPILPRQNSAAASCNSSELPATKLQHLPAPTTAATAAAAAAYGFVNNKVNKVPASKKSPNNAANLAHANVNGNGNGHGNGNGSQALIKASSNAAKRNSSGNSKQQMTPTNPNLKLMAPPAHPHTHLNTPLGIASSANQLNFFKENLMRAQAAAATNPSNLLFNFAPAVYSYQQACLMEQLSRMQRAGHEVFNDYLQKVRSAAGGTNEGAGGEHTQQLVMPMLPNVTLPTPPSTHQPLTLAASPKSSPHATNKLTPAATPKGNSNNGSSGGSGKSAATSSSSNNNNNNNSLSLAKSK